MCRDADQNIVGIARLFNGNSHQLRSRLVSGTQFGAIAIVADGNFDFDCETFSETTELQVTGNLACGNAVAMLMQGL